MCCQRKLRKVKASVASDCSVNVHLLSWFVHIISLLEAEAVRLLAFVSYFFKGSHRAK